MKARLSLRQGAALTLAPAARLAVRLLRLGNASLCDEIMRELERNPFLRVRWPDTPVAALPLQDPPAPQLSLFEDLRQQIGLMAVTPTVRNLAFRLLGELHEDGYLDDAALDLLRAEGARAPDIDAALAALQSCDPPGVGARDLRECLELQLYEAGLPRNAAADTVGAMREFAAGNMARVAKILSISEDEADRRADLLRGLRSRPVDPGNVRDTPVVARADLRVSAGPDGRLQIAVARDVLPRVSLDEALMRSAGKGGFGASDRARATALVAALDYRTGTLDRVGAALLEHQHGYFRDGIEMLRPLSRQTLAAALDVHPSTVGRAVAGKHIEIRGRLVPMENLFSRALPDRSRGGNVAAGAVRQRIAAIIGAEPCAAPLSDARIAERLVSEGVDIARRTVAKYRQQLRIPPAAARGRAKPRRPAQPRAGLSM